jgi:spermidine synthase
MKFHQFAFFVLFVASGFSGLIYESLWAQYLKLFLGHAAYAQTLVLSIFMAGMALGSWWVSRYSKRLKAPVLAYALVEFVIGICALCFHSVYSAAVRLSFDSVLVGLHSPWAVMAWKWGLSSLMILPQSILLGATFPLLTAGLHRLMPDRPGYILGWLYFTNSTGAAVGVLVAGFYLIPTSGLPGAILFAGIVNLLVGLVAFFLHMRRVEPSAVEAENEHAEDSPDFPLLLCMCALFTGLASFFYEIGWIRMLTLVLGASTHSFELMLSAFISGLAIGGFLVRGYIERCKNLLLFLASVQLMMGACALLTVVFYEQSFAIMAFLMKALRNSEQGYILFNLGSHLISSMIMLPATVCAGMTLPLITARLLRTTMGEASIGLVYAFNTVGAILGVVVGSQIIMPMLGMKALLIAGVLVDIALGLFLLVKFGRLGRFVETALGAVSLGAVLYVAAVVEFSPATLSSGVYRYANTSVKGDFSYFRDGVTATIAVRTGKEALVFTTNGKPYAGVSILEESSEDESTMVLLGSLPFIFNPLAQTVGVIGLGTGITTATVLKQSQVKQVDTIEIEPAVAEAAKLVGDRVLPVFSDPRSRVHFEDAKTFFTAYGALYDVIISEPSNPWVSGVAGLFSTEFYEHVVRHLKPDGMLVQWLQLYEFDVRLVASVMKALSPHFEDYLMIATSQGDIAVLAKPRGRILKMDEGIFTHPESSQALAGIGITSLADIWKKRIGPKHILDPLFNGYEIPANSDFFPVLASAAVQSRFLRLSGTDLLALGFSSIGLEQVLNPELFHSQMNPEVQEAAIVLADPTSEQSYVGGDLRTFSRAWDSNYCGKKDDVNAWLMATHEIVRPMLRNVDLGLVAAGIGNLVNYPCIESLDEMGRNWIKFYWAWASNDPTVFIDAGFKLLLDPNISRNDSAFVSEFILLMTVRLRNSQTAQNVIETIEPYKDISLGTRMIFYWIKASLEG